MSETHVEEPERLRLELNQVRAALEQATAEVGRLEKLVYLAGHWSCPKCDFYLVSTNLHVPSGGFSANREPQACANGCGPMWRVTHEQSANTMVDRCEKQADHIEQLEAAICELWVRADTSDLDAEMALFVGGVVAEEMKRDRQLLAGGSNQEFNTAKRRPDAGLSETESPEGDATARTSGRGSDGDSES